MKPTKKLIITSDLRDQFSNYLKSVTVPSLVGASLIQIATALDQLEEASEVKEELKDRM